MEFYLLLMKLYIASLTIFVYKQYIAEFQIHSLR